MRYRKKPIIVEAYQWFRHMGATPAVRNVPAHNVDYTKKNAEGKEIGRGIIHEAPERYVCDTLEGPIDVSDGDYIITSINGEVYPCKPDIFSRTYEKYEEYEGSLIEKIKTVIYGKYTEKEAYGRGLDNGLQIAINIVHQHNTALINHLKRRKSKWDSKDYCRGIDDAIDAIMGGPPALGAEANGAKEPQVPSPASDEHGDFVSPCNVDGGLKRERQGDDTNSPVCTNSSEQMIQSEISDSDLAEGVLKLTKNLRYIQGIVERGENRKLRDDECVDIAILNYVKKLEDAEGIQQEYYKRGWKEAQEHYSKPVSVEECAKALWKESSGNGLDWQHLQNGYRREAKAVLDAARVKYVD